MSEKTVTIGVRVSPKLRSELAEIAKEERRSLSQIVNFMIEEGLARRREDAKRRR